MMRGPQAGDGQTATPYVFDAAVSTKKNVLAIWLRCVP
jgi:hypothetical protein